MPAGSLPAAGGLASDRPPLPLSIAVLAVPAVVAVVRLLLAAGPPFDLLGDEAILESSVRHVGDQLVGPYSRFGFHQPGPAYYYLQAPFYRLSGASAVGLFFGAFCINLGAAIGSVLVIRRILGETAARWSSVVVGGLLLCFTPALLANPWNPYVLAVPVLFTIVLAAAAAGGSPAAAGGAAVVGSYVVQTHLAAAATLAMMAAAAGVVGAGLHLLRRRSPSPDATPPLPGARWRTMAPLGAAVIVLVLMWAPPLVEQATRAPGNLTKVTRFFRASHPDFDQGIDHSLGRTAGQVAAELTVLPFGHDREMQPVRRSKVVVAGGGLLAGVAVAMAGWRRRWATVAALGASSVVGTLTAIWSGTQIVGEAFPYLLVWTSALLLPGAIGAGVLLLARYRRLVALAAVGVGLSLTWTMARHPIVPYRTATDVGVAARLARPWLAEHRTPTVRIRIAHHDQWPLATGLAVRLEKDGLRATVDQNWTFLFGDHFRPTGHEPVMIWIAGTAAEPPDGAGLTRLGIAGGASLWAGPLSDP